jgi:porphobilinogen deaminase
MSRLDAGKSDSRRVLQIEQEWVDARIANYQGLVEHRRAWLDLEVAQGIMLDNRGLEPAVVQ